MNDNPYVKAKVTDERIVEVSVRGTKAEVSTLLAVIFKDFAAQANISPETLLSTVAERIHGLNETGVVGISKQVVDAFNNMRKHQEQGPAC